MKRVYKNKRETIAQNSLTNHINILKVNSMISPYILWNVQI